jgi:2-iminobutanoate/2-iminopropanoate deaminase
MRIKVIIVITISVLLCSCTRRSIYTTLAPPPIATYSQAMLIENTLYVSGQIALRTDGTLDTSNIKNECRQVMTNIRSIVKAAKMSMNNVTKCTIYLTDLKHFNEVDEVYGEFIDLKCPPARETVQVQALPKGAHVEISVIAVR